MHDLFQKLKTVFWPNLRPSIPDEIQSEVKRLPTSLHNEFYFQYEHMVTYLKRRRNVSLLALSVCTISTMSGPVGFWMVFPIAYALIVNRLADPNRVQQLYNKVLLQFGYLPVQEEQSNRLQVVRRPTQDHKLLHVREGDLLDYKTVTWQIQQIEDLDYASDKCVRRFFLYDMQQERSAILLLKAEHEVELYWGVIFSPYLLDNHIDTLLKVNGRPLPHVFYKELQYLLEDIGKYTIHRHRTPSTAHQPHIKYWEYMDRTREQMLRIEQPDELNLRAYSFEKISPYAITGFVY